MRGRAIVAVLSVAAATYAAAPATAPAKDTVPRGAVKLGTRASAKLYQDASRRCNRGELLVARTTGVRSDSNRYAKLTVSGRQTFRWTWRDANRARTKVCAIIVTFGLRADAQNPDRVTFYAMRIRPDRQTRSGGYVSNPIGRRGVPTYDNLVLYLAKA